MRKRTHQHNGEKAMRADPEQPPFDVTKLEGFVPIDEAKNLELPDFDENNPLHVAFAETLAQAIVRMRRQGATSPETPSDEVKSEV